MKRFLRFLSIPLVVLLIASTCSTAFVTIAFNANKAFIIKELCVNRFRPEMKCDGKCYLKKQLKKDKKDHNHPINSENHSLNWFSTTIALFQTFDQEGDVLEVGISTDNSQSYYPSFDHPPSKA